MPADWLNYHHLLYFWTAVRQGGVARAAEELGVSQPTVSGQIKELEAALGEALFARAGRRLVPTEMGRVVFSYADQIFALGRELTDTVRNRRPGRPQRLVVGVADAVPKIVARLLLEPACRAPHLARLVCREGKVDALLPDLAAYRLDVVISDLPIGAVRFRGRSHLLGECPVSFFARPPLAGRLRRGFPESLHGAPVYLPADTCSMRRGLDQWFASLGIAPDVIGEFDDLALMKTFGQTGQAAFPAPSVAEEEIGRMYGVSTLGRVEAVRERYYAITAERRLRHPAVIAVSEAARAELFA